MSEAKCTECGGTGWCEEVDIETRTITEYRCDACKPSRPLSKSMAKRIEAQSGPAQVTDETPDPFQVAIWAKKAKTWDELRAEIMLMDDSAQDNFFGQGQSHALSEVLAKMRELEGK